MKGHGKKQPRIRNSSCPRKKKTDDTQWKSFGARK